MGLRKIIKTIICEYLAEQQKVKSSLNSNFWMWFNGSQMINTNNSPKIYYNGSSKKFNVFKYDKITDKYQNNILGFFFSENKKIAEMYGSDIKPCFLMVKNPKILSDTDFQKHLNYTNATDLLNMKLQLINDGFDGIDYGAIVVAFNSNQIKSVHNDGTWDINDKNIYS